MTRSSERVSVGPSNGDGVVSVYEEQLLTPLSRHLESLVRRLAEDAALGLILIDATPLLEIERHYGSGPVCRALEALAQHVHSRVPKDLHESLLIAAGAPGDEHILLFLSRPYSDHVFYTQVLPRLAEDLRGDVAVCLKRIVYPYLCQPPEIPVAHGITLYRPFHRPEAQIHRLVELTESTAHFELERIRRERAATLERILLEETLLTAYQPIVRLPGREVIGYEALMRGPAGSGLENPLSLFQVAQACDREYEVDRLCRRQALRNAKGIERDQKLFLNILPSSIHDPEFEDARIQTMLGELGLGPRNLVLEISEQKAIGNFPIFREATDYFSKLGFGIALDDIGAGFSSLGAVLELSPDFLKIDMSLVRGIQENPQKQELLRGLQTLAQKMNSTIIAEGIEAPGELEIVEALGISCVQGYLLGRAGLLGGSDEASTSS